MIRIDPQVLFDVTAHGREEAPIEACGYLGGVDGHATASIRLRNVDASSEHFTLDPEEQFAAIRSIRAKGLKLLGVYHSHPASPARPSQEDIRLAYDPSLSYVIVSLQGVEVDVKSYRIASGKVLPEPIEGEGRSFYDLPASLDREIDDLEGLIRDRLEGRLDAAALKARRVPFGIYEQRKDETFMTRVRCPGGALTPRQLRALADLSDEFGSSFLHVTTRQEVQIHDVALEKIPYLLRRLRIEGLSSRGGGGNTVRNILASSDSGVAKDEVFDVLPYALALTDRLIAEGDSWVLPRKYKIAFSNSAKDNAYGAFNDLGLLAVLKDGRKGFKVYVAGGMGSKPQVGHLLHDFIPAADVYLVAKAIKLLFDKHGNRKNKNAARLRFLWNSLGRERFVELYEAELASLRLQGLPAFVPKDLPWGGPLKTTVTLEHVAPSEGFEVWKKRFAVEQHQKGYYSVTVPIFLGQLPSDQARTISDLAHLFGDDALRATIGQNLQVRHVPDAALPEVHRILSTVSEWSAQSALLGRSIACTGANTCKLGICLPQGLLPAVARRLKKSGLDLDALGDFKLNISGCPNTCGQHLLADLGFYGKVGRFGSSIYPAYVVVAGAVTQDGKARLAKAIGDVPARDVPEYVEKALEGYLAVKNRYPHFADYVDAEGEKALRDLADRFKEIPAFEEDKNYYYDWGASEVFSLVGRGVGECSAGLFDLIDLDLKAAQEALRNAEKLPDDDTKGKALLQAVLAASRMLLITRGSEATAPAAVLDAFKTHFLDSGLVPGKFALLISAAQDENLSALRSSEGDVRAFVGALEALYGQMDQALRFPAEKAASSTPAAASAAASHAEDAFKDFRGVACPMNFVKTKLALDPLKKGQTLRILLDDGAPIENVPRSVSAEGHKILEQEKKDGHWTVLIEKV
jgi:sulfite reductase (ferredoxin)